MIDCDVHQGNGTAAIFRDDPTVFTFRSTAAATTRSSRSAATSISSWPTAPATPTTLRRWTPGWIGPWRAPPGLVFYLAGADPYRGDRYGRLALSRQGLAARDRKVFAVARLWACR